MSSAHSMGQFVPWDGGCLFIGRGGGVVPPHAHYAIQVAFCSAPGIRFRADEREAHAAGFADAAHLSRTSRSMFGFPPSAMQVAAPVRAAAERERVT